MALARCLNLSRCFLDLGLHGVVSRSMSTSFKSAISLSRLYPKSSLDLTSPVKIPESNESTFSGYIPIDSLDITYSRSSGPGGQHVNTTETKVDIRFHLNSASWLSDEVKEKLAKMFKNRITKDGFFVVRSEKTRFKLYNQADAMMSLRQMIGQASAPIPEPSEDTLHMHRKRKEKSNKERLLEKRKHSIIKASRSDDDVNQ